MYRNFKSSEITPKGWMLQQLKIQANGLSGNLDKVWPDIADSDWIGGRVASWERVPYWLDGFIPLAYLLKDDDMIARAEKYVNGILDRQQEDGWICPGPVESRKTYDLWALFLIGKVLSLYCDLTGSERAKKGLYRAMKSCFELWKKDEIVLYQWGKFRWFECLIPLRYLYDQYKEEWILEFAEMLRRDGEDYFNYIETWKRPLNQWVLNTHIVNICMMLKTEAVCCRMFGEKYENKAEKLWNILEKYNGTCVGLFTGDECLAGKANNQGTELCGVVELMYSCEILYAVTGKEIWAKRLEKIAFNALPATLSDDMWTHQYVQMANQIACIKLPGRAIFRTNGPESHLFGLEPHYGCCTANFNQGWPKLALSIFLKNKTGIECALMLPAELNTQIKGANVTVANESEYPFRHLCKTTVSVDRPVEFELKIRIPQWTESVQLNGQEIPKTRFVKIKKVWDGSETVTLQLSDAPHFVSRPKGLKTVEYGPLVFALPIKAEWKKREYERNGVVRKYPYCDYELYPMSEWRYGFTDGEFKMEERKGDDVPFSSVHPRLVLKANLSRVNWEFADGFETIAADAPKSNKAISESEEMELYPYGCAKLRVTELPKIKEMKK